MSRLSKFLVVLMVVVFLLACSTLTQPVQNAEDLAKTAQAIGSAIPAGTLQALPSMAPSLQAIETAIPLGEIFNPQGAPVREWKGIPVMPQATAGQEFPKDSTYSFKATTTLKDVQDFYNQKLAPLGWKQPFNLPAEGDASLMIFQKDNSTLTITITSSENTCVVVLTMP